MYFIGNSARYRLHCAGGFTLVELLISVTVIVILAGMVLGALNMAREEARASATKATIAKLHRIIMERYESYQTRRVPLDLSGLSPRDAARVRLHAIRDLMRMEMPDRLEDIMNDPVPITVAGRQFAVQRPALSILYRQRVGSQPVAQKYLTAKMLFLIVTLGTPEAREQFSHSEIGTTEDGYQVFVDGWGTPIMFFRWAPGFTPESQIQTGDPVNDHDPLDPMGIEPNAYKLVPLIYSAGRDKRAGLEVMQGYVYQGNPYAGNRIGVPVVEDGYANTHRDNIHNHRIEAR